MNSEVEATGTGFSGPPGIGGLGLQDSQTGVHADGSSLTHVAGGNLGTHGSE